MQNKMLKKGLLLGIVIIFVPFGTLTCYFVSNAHIYFKYLITYYSKV